MEKENNNNININESKEKLNVDLEKKEENEIFKENINIQSSKKNNQDEKKVKLLKILFGENTKNKDETKLNENIGNDDKIFYETSSDFHKARLPKIKFRITKEIENINNNNNNVKEYKSDKINIDLNENLNINKEKKKMKKIVKKKVKKKKQKNKKEDINEQNETFTEKLEGDIESSIQDEKLSNSVQERKIDHKQIFNLIKNDEKKENKGENIKGNEKDKQKVKENNNEEGKNNESKSSNESKKDKENEKNKEEIENKKVKYNKKERNDEKETENNSENIKENEKDKKKDKVKIEEEYKDNINEKENNKDSLIEKDNKLIKEKEKEKDIKIAKKEIIRKLIKYSGKKYFDEKNIIKKKTELNLSKNLTNKDNIKDLIERKKNDYKNDSLIKREQIINAKLINNNSLSYKERIRRKQLEKDLEKEINNDDLSDDPYEEIEIDLINKNEEFKSHSTNKRKILKKKDKEDKIKNKKLNNSLTNRKKIYNLNSYKKLNPIQNKIYTPKKAINSRENSKIKIIDLNKKMKNKMKTMNNNIFDRDFNPKENIIKTKFKIFNDNIIKEKKALYPTYNNNTLDFNHPSSIEISYIKNRNNINVLGKNNIKHKKILYIKKSPTRERNDKIEINNNYYTNFNTINNNRTNNNEIYINSFNKNKFKKIITKRINTNNISLTERNISYQSNEFNSQILNDSNYEDLNNTSGLNPNDMINIEKIKKLNTNANNSFTFRKHIKIPNPLQQSIPKINLEDLYLIENKFFNIIHNLGERKEIANDCFDLFNYYYNCSIYQSLLKFFNDPNTIKLNTNYTLMSLLISYDLSFNKNKLKKIYLLLLEMFIVNYRNLMLIIEYIINKINKNDINQIWINILSKKIIKYKESQEGEEIDSYNNFGLTIFEKIKYNTHYLMQKIHYILLNYDENNNNSNNLLFFLKTINANSYDKINIFFKENIIRENFAFCSLLASSLIKNNINKKNQTNEPFIQFPNKKKYSLILDLDENLINLDKIKNENNGTLKIRPGTFTFLEKMKKYFEIIIFSEAEQNYVDIIINSMEENGKFFDYILYRQHTTIENEEFIKDLSKLGRKLSRMIIVDNMPQNFRLQPENGIYIKPFWGDDNDDDVLFSLAKILDKIVCEGGDLREGLKKFKNEIIINISASYKED